MRRETLVAFFRDFLAADRARDATFIVHDNGFRTRAWTYGETSAAARAFAGRLRAAGIRPGDPVVIWAENRGEWIAALWGVVIARAVAVPVDFRSSADQAHRIRDIVRARILVAGADVEPREGTDYAVWRMDDAKLWNSERGTEPGERTEPGEPTELAEIIFTSGATADPKGVTLTQRNILANLEPIEAELVRYRRFLRLVSPLRFLNLLPLSHMFGQSLATFVPPMIGGTVVFSRGYNPHEIVRQIKERRVSVLVCVPKVLEVLREHVAARVGAAGTVSHEPPAHWLRRLWRHRAVHREFGWKFWAIVVGGAPLDPALEQFWRDRGFLVIQGYGLTETAPIVTLSHPLRKSAPGSVGTPIGGVEIRIADDGEVLVRGENVTPGYYGAQAETRQAFSDGWFHTGDIGTLDSEGRLTIRGRKKEMIVTSDGLNVFPDDVERVLNVQPGVRESAIVGVHAPGGEERVHAVLVMSADASAAAAVSAANGALEPHQRIRSWSAWPGGALPRTEGTRKLRRKEIQRGIETQAPMQAAVPGATVAEMVAAAAGGRPVTRETTFDELGLSSLDRMQLLARIEEAFGISLDETEFGAAANIGELENLVEPREPRTEPVEPVEPREPGERAVLRPPRISFPRWNRSLPARAARRVLLSTIGLAPGRIFARLDVQGLENLDGLDHPVIFAPNHQSHMDTVAVLQALPPRWRYRVAPAMAKEWFKAHFFPHEHPVSRRIRNSLSYYTASLIYNAFPIPQYEAGARQTIRYIGQLLEERHSLLIYPEGKRTDYGEIAVFRPGVGMMAARLQVPVVPVRIEGLDRVLSVRANWPTRGRARITFGNPMRLEGSNYVQLSAQVRDAVIALQPYTEPDPGSVAQ